MGSLERGLELKKPTGFHPAPLTPSVRFSRRIRCQGLPVFRPEVQVVTEQAPVESAAVFAAAVALVPTEAGWRVAEQ